MAERRGRKLLRAKNLIKVVKQRPEHLKEAEKGKTQKIVDDDIDVNMNIIRRRVAEMENETREGVQGLGEERQTNQATGDQDERGSTSGDSDDSRFTITYDDQEERVEDVGYHTTKSGRAVVPPDKFSPVSTTKRSKLSPRERKRRQSMRKKEKRLESDEGRNC